MGQKLTRRGFMAAAGLAGTSLATLAACSSPQASSSSSAAASSAEEEASSSMANLEASSEVAAKPEVEEKDDLELRSELGITQSDMLFIVESDNKFRVSRNGSDDVDSWIINYL